MGSWSSDPDEPKESKSGKPHKVTYHFSTTEEGQLLSIDSISQGVWLLGRSLLLKGTLKEGSPILVLCGSAGRVGFRMESACPCRSSPLVNEEIVTHTDTHTIKNQPVPRMLFQFSGQSFELTISIRHAHPYLLQQFTKILSTFILLVLFTNIIIIALRNNH